MKLSRNKIAKLLKNGNQSRKNNKNPLRTKSLGNLADDDMVFQQKHKRRIAHSAHKRGPVNLRLKTMKLRNKNKGQSGGVAVTLTNVTYNVFDRKGGEPIKDLSGKGKPFPQALLATDTHVYTYHDKIVKDESVIKDERKLLDDEIDDLSDDAEKELKKKEDKLFD